ncbi:MAG: hypothetical protein JWO36_3467, partial [Myxococcales bacterium]|nr:hypothetical protein [Myxococcales bacterium]
PACGAVRSQRSHQELCCLPSSAKPLRSHKLRALPVACSEHPREPRRSRSTVCAVIASISHSTSGSTRVRPAVSAAIATPYRRRSALTSYLAIVRSPRRRSSTLGHRAHRSTRFTRERSSTTHSISLSKGGKTPCPSQTRIPPATDGPSRRRGGHPTLSWWLGEPLGWHRVQPRMRLAFAARPRRSARDCDPTCPEMAMRRRRHYGTALSP